MDIQRIILQVSALVFAVIIHEVAHGWVAFRLGDPTAKMMGRITLNPIRHLDPVGSVILPLVLALSHSPIMIGWAKPVPVQIRNLRQLPRDSILVSVAGVTANLIGVFVGGLAVRWLVTLPQLGSPAFPWTALHSLTLFLGYFVVINLFLMLLNLTPIPPLDGGRIVADLLPARWSAAYMRLQPAGILIVIALLYIGVLDRLWWLVIGPVLTLALGYEGLLFLNNAF